MSEFPQDIQADAGSTYDAASLCSEHAPGIEWPLLQGRAIAYWNNGQDEFESIAVFHLEDGRFCVIQEFSDYTGHGCRCSADTSLYQDRAEMLRLGLTPECSGSA